MAKYYRPPNEKKVDELTAEERQLYAYEIAHNEPLPSKVGQANAYFTVIKPNLELIRSALEKGTLVKDICDGLGISQTTFFKNLNIYSEFAEVYNACRQVQIRAVEGALFKSAQGHKTTIKKAIKTRDGFTYADEEVYTPPNPQAQQFLLKNLMSKVYKDKVEVEQTIKVDVHHINSSSTEDLLEMISIAKSDAVDVDFVQIDEAPED